MVLNIACVVIASEHDIDCANVAKGSLLPDEDELLARFEGDILRVCA
jgi:hypothetical protein